MNFSVIKNFKMNSKTEFDLNDQIIVILAVEVTVIIFWRFFILTIIHIIARNFFISKNHSILKIYPVKFHEYLNFFIWRYFIFCYHICYHIERMRNLIINLYFLLNSLVF